MIKVLEKSVADKIAAGEVIENPASIVKELVENSIDSGAKSIVIEIKKGGKTYIRVTDNGSGINKEEVLLAFLRHATSKITSAKDLDYIGTLGFRGEALASIAAVTRVEMITKEKEAIAGRKIVLEGGKVVENTSTGCPDGTTIVIKDLFFNTPARLKFLKTDSAETSKITDLVSRIAVGFPDISFRFMNNGKLVFATDGRGNRKTAIANVYGHGDFDNLLEVYYKENSYLKELSAYVSKPTISRPSRRNQIYFVNGRAIESKIIDKAVAWAYRERMFEGRFPIAFIFLEIDPSILDVNIHPNKKTIRFDNEDEIIAIISDQILKVIMSEESLSKVSEVFEGSRGENIVRIDASKDIETQSTDTEKEIYKKNYGKSYTEDQVDIKKLLATLSRNSGSKEIVDSIDSKLDVAISTDNTSFESLQRSESGASFVSTPIVPYKDRAKIDRYIPKVEFLPFDIKSLKITGSIFNSYITAIDESNFYLIDQHAAHERVFYEEFVIGYLNDDIPRQQLILPLVLNLTPELEANSDLWISKLDEMGFTLENFGPNTYRATEIPDFMSLNEAENFMISFIENMDEHLDYNNTVIINKLITRSCKSAVKAHDKLSMMEMEGLLSDLGRCRNPFSCPHGRPIFVKFTQYDLEKMFKRA